MHNTVTRLGFKICQGATEATWLSGTNRTALQLCTKPQEPSKTRELSDSEIPILGMDSTRTQGFGHRAASGNTVDKSKIWGTDQMFAVDSWLSRLC